MKRFWFIIATAGLIAGMTAEAAPFYKVQCYDANDKLVNCNDIANVKKHAKVKTRSKIAKAKRSDSLAQKKAREKAIALRELAQQNEELKSEMQALRKANLLAAAKTEEKPADTAQLAATTTVQVPAPATPISTTQVAKDPEADNKSPWSFEAMNWVSKSMAANTPLANELDLSAAYAISPEYAFALEDDPVWNWTNPKNDPKQGFAFGDIQPIFIFNNIYTSPSKQTILKGDINGWVGVSEASRDQGMIMNARFRLKLITKINDGKGWFRFDPFVTPVIRRYTTSAPTGALTDSNTFSMNDGSSYEKLQPYSRLETGIKVWFHHTISGGLSFESTIKIRGKYTYADELDTGSEIITLTDAHWMTDIQLELPRIMYTVNDNLTIDGALLSLGSLSSFRPYSIDNGNDLQFLFRITYDI